MQIRREETEQKRDRFAALRRAGATIDGEAATGCVPKLTKAELYAMGLAGTPDSAARRAKLQKALDLPAGLTANALLDVLNALVTREELTALVEKIQK